MDDVRTRPPSLRELEEENAHLKTKLRLLGAGERESMFSIPDKMTAAPQSISGLQIAYLQVNGDNRVTGLNTRMAQLLGAEKEAAVGKALSELDLIPWARGVLGTLLRESRTLKGEIEFETSALDTISGTTRYYGFRVTPGEQADTIVIEDRTTFRRILAAFQRYVSPRVIERMQDSTQDFFRTDRLEITILFADLRGFTTMCSQLSPEEVKDTVNEFLAAMIAVVDQHEATVDKIIGDAVMALFGAPVPFKDHVHRAIKTAMGMQRAHESLLQKWKTDRRPAPPLGIGINTGVVIVGNIGSNTRTSYTALGHHVNLASRLCDAAEGGDILVSMNTVAELSRYAASYPEDMKEKISFQKAGTLKAKGIKEPVEIARVVYR
jgi:class 3 adenylate cyclase